ALGHIAAAPLHRRRRGPGPRSREMGRGPAARLPDEGGRGPAGSAKARRLGGRGVQRAGGRPPGGDRRGLGGPRV
ncbi:MAG: hypothetical protein AVDCRST_MAG12-635, partial [uncultured Rubrobacteraceae bacterium]